ncbi:MAG TPA: serine/threonine-protein kinase [Polyangia bacterium]
MDRSDTTSDGRVKRRNSALSGPATAAFPIGRFGLFRLIDRIDDGAGEGGSELYRALWAFMPREPERLCVVKRLRPELCSSPAFVRMFEKEAEVLAALDHPNLVKTYERGLVETVPYVAMEWLEGIDLSSLMRSIRLTGGSLSVEVAIYIAHEVARGLAHGHAASNREGNPLKLVHRDVKPTNVVLMPNGGVKLIEFGATRVSSFIGQNVTTEGARGNRPSYVAPEQVRGGMIDARADLFSLGAVLWEMLTGRPLFPAADPRETINKLLNAELIRPSVLRPEVPAALDDVVMKMLHRDLNLRHQTAISVTQDLTQFLPAPADDARAVGSLVRSHMETRPAVPGASLLPSGKPVPPALAGVLEAVVNNMRAGGLAGRLPGSLRKITSFVPMVAAKFPRRAAPRPSNDLAPAISINTPAGSFKMPRRPLWHSVASVMAAVTLVVGVGGGWLYAHRSIDGDEAYAQQDTQTPTMMEASWTQEPAQPVSAGIVIESLPPPVPAANPGTPASPEAEVAPTKRKPKRVVATKATRRKRGARVQRRRVTQVQAAATALRPAKK